MFFVRDQREGLKGCVYARVTLNATGTMQFSSGERLLWSWLDVLSTLVIYIYIYICRIRTYDGRLNPFLFVGLATVLLYCYLDMLNLYLTRSAIRPRGSCFSLGREIVFGKTTIFKRLGTKIYVYNTLEITPGFDIIWYRFRSFLNSKVFR